MGETSNNINVLSGTVSSLMRNIQGRVTNILNFDSKKINAIVAGFLQKVSQQKDKNGHSNPRVVRSYIHTMLPEFKSSPEFRKLDEHEK